MARQVSRQFAKASQAAEAKQVAEREAAERKQEQEKMFTAGVTAGEVEFAFEAAKAVWQAGDTQATRTAFAEAARRRAVFFQ